MMRYYGETSKVLAANQPPWKEGKQMSKKRIVEFSGGDQRCAVIEGRVQAATLAQLGCPENIIREIRSHNEARKSPQHARLAAIDADYEQHQQRNIPTEDELRAKAARLAGEMR
ncbi:MAG: hypothetical protein ACHP8B_10860 [Terriglobales bacterium]